MLILKSRWIAELIRYFTVSAEKDGFYFGVYRVETGYANSSNEYDFRLFCLFDDLHVSLFGNCKQTHEGVAYSISMSYQVQQQPGTIKAELDWNHIYDDSLWLAIRDKIYYNQ